MLGIHEAEVTRGIHEADMLGIHEADSEHLRGPGVRAAPTWNGFPLRDAAHALDSCSVFEIPFSASQIEERSRTVV